MSENGVPSREAGSDDGTQFLLTEFQMVRALKDQSVNISDKRVDVHLGLASAVAGGLVLLAQTHISSQDLLVASLVGSAFLLLVGLTTFRHVVNRDVLTVDYIRAGNRIRAYFSERASTIRPYLLMPTSHKYPPYGWQSSNRALTLCLNALSLGVLTTVAITLQQQRAWPVAIYVYAGMVAGVLLYLLQLIYANRVFASAERSAQKSDSVNLSTSAKTS